MVNSLLYFTRNSEFSVSHNDSDLLYYRCIVYMMNVRRAQASTHTAVHLNTALLKNYRSHDHCLLK